jgi:hypothetical protein
MMRKTASRPKSGSPEKQEGRKKSLRPKNTSAEVPALHGVRPPAPGSGKRGEDGHIAYLLRQAQAATRLTLERALADLGVTPPQFAVLTMLNAYPGLSGAIQKTPHPVHGRVLQWTLTRRGVGLLDQCRRRVTTVERRLVAGLNARAEVTIRRWLSRIASDLHEGDRSSH